MEETVVRRLCALGRIWGAVKFLHPYTGYREDLDWDQALLRAIPAVMQARLDRDLHRAIDGMLGALGDPLTRRVPCGADGDEPAGPQAPPVISPGRPEPALDWLDARTALVTARDVGQFAAFAREDAFVEACRSAARAETVLLDLRVRASPLDPACEFLHAGLTAGLPMLLNRPVAPYGVRTRRHEGYAAQAGGSGLYSSGFSVQCGTPLACDPALSRPPRLVMLVGPHSAGLEGLLGGLQAAGSAVVVAEGGWPAPGTTNPVRWQVDAGTAVVIATGEWVSPAGSVGPVPSVPLPAADGPAGQSGRSDPAIAAALTAAAGRSGAAPAPAAGHRPSPWAAVRERAYDGLPLTQAHRILGLFRLWTVIHYFFPYHDLAPDPWERALPRFLPQFAAADDLAAYTLAVRTMLAGLGDSHGKVWCPHLPPLAEPELSVRAVGHRTLVTWAGDGAAREQGVGPGDCVLAVDGIPTERRRADLRPGVCGSTPQAVERAVDNLLLCGEAGVPARLTVRTPTGVRECVLERRAAAAAEREPPLAPAAVLPEGFGYIDLSRVDPGEVDAALEAVRETPAIIFDLRRYPRGNAWALAPRLFREPAAWATFRCPVVSGPDLPADAEAGGVLGRQERQWAVSHVSVRPGGPWQYAGRLVGLMGPDTISLGEYTAMLLAAAGARFVGEPTNGANGDVTSTILPGGIGVAFTGQAAMWPDGRALQRAGIRPHVHAAPSAEGLRAGRDEVLEAAVAWLGTGGPAPTQ